MKKYAHIIAFSLLYCSSGWGMMEPTDIIPQKPSKAEIEQLIDNIERLPTKFERRAEPEETAKVAANFIKGKKVQAACKTLSMWYSYLKYQFIPAEHVTIKGETFLHVATRLADIKPLKKAIKWGVPIDHMNIKGMTALHICIHEGYADKFDLLLSHGASPSMCSGNKQQNALHLALQHGDVKITKSLCNYLQTQEATFRRAVLEARDAENQTPLEYALYNGNPELLECLLKTGANSNNSISCGCTPLAYAVSLQQEISVLGLLGYKANYKAPSCNRIPPIFVAAAMNNTAIVCLLLGMGVPATIEYGNYTLLDIAERIRNIDMVNILMNDGAEPKQCNNTDQSWQKILEIIRDYDILADLEDNEDEIESLELPD